MSTDAAPRPDAAPLHERADRLRLEQPATWDALERFVARLVADGTPEDEAVRRALEALGR